MVTGVEVCIGYIFSDGLSDVGYIVCGVGIDVVVCGF